MNKAFIAVLAVPAMAVSLAACGPKGTTATSAAASSAKAYASANKQAGETAASTAVAQCLPKAKQTESNLIQIALSPSQRKKLAQCLDIPKANVKPFVNALAISALNAEQVGDFKTHQGRVTYVTQVLPVVVEKFQAK